METWQISHCMIIPRNVLERRTLGVLLVQWTIQEEVHIECLFSLWS